MANLQVSNTWTFDSVMAQPYTKWVFINDLSWDEQVSAGDQLVIKDQNGNLILDTKASAPNVLERFGRIGWQNGFQVTTIGSGKVMVYIR